MWIGILAVLLLTGITVAVVTSWNPFAGSPGRVYEATFATARQVNGDTPVRIDGVQVGRVEDVRYDARDRTARVRFRITDEDVVLRRDVDVALRWRTLLGGRMELAVDPGSRSAEPLPGDRIPGGRTRVQTELEDVARIVRGDARRGLRTTFRELPDALAGDDAGRALRDLGDLRDAVPAARALRGEARDDLPGLVRAGGRALAATAATADRLERVVTDGASTLRAAGARRAELRAALATAPAALDETRRLAAAVDRTLPVLDPLLAELRPGARRLDPALRRTAPALRTLSATLRDARPVLREVDRALPPLTTASERATGLLRGLRPTSVRLLETLVPFLERTDEDVRLPVYQLIGPTFSSVSAMSGLIGDDAHVVNFPITVGERSQMLLPCSTFDTDPTPGLVDRCENLDQALAMLLGVSRGRTGGGR
ncbi:MAG: MlaD family protein [Solirubrobacteraceae bacterium]|nr:MlaD family protein [Solirubrobacteraceae bacterium]